MAEICRRLDGLPLALELAAAQARALPPAALLEALESRLSVLTDGPIDLPERQQTLRDAIAWSYDLLEPAEQELCRRVAVFRGGCGVDAARQVCSLDGDAAAKESLRLLVGKSLLVEDLREEGGAGKLLAAGDDARVRFGMLETIREFALEQLQASTEADAVFTRHREWVAALCREAEPHLRGPDSPAWLDRLDDEHDNVRAAMGRAVERGGDDSTLALEIGATLPVFWFHHGYFSEGRDWLERGLEAARGAAAGLRAKALYGAAGMARYQAEEHEASRLCEESVALYREIGDKRGVARVLAEHGATLDRLGERERAADVLHEALDLHRELGERERTAFTLNMLGNLALNTGRLADAREHFEESLAIAEADQDGNNALTALLNLGEVRRLEGDDADAGRRLRASLTHILEFHQRNALAYCLEMIAGIEAGSGDAELSARLFGVSEALREELGTPIEPFNLERYRNDVAQLRKRLERGAPRGHLAGRAQRRRGAGSAGSCWAPPDRVSGPQPGPATSRDPAASRREVAGSHPRNPLGADF